MPTLVFCTSFAQMPEVWNGRYLRWLNAIRTSELEYDRILIVDDGSPALPDWPEVVIETDGADERPKDFPTELVLYHFQKNLGRNAVFDFPGWYRSFAFAGRYARQNGFNKVIHVESDSYIIGTRVQDYFNNFEDGWAALWCPLYSGYPESAIQIMAGSAISRFAEIARTHPHESLIGKEFELQLPFDIVEKRFNGNRYGEYLSFVPGNAEYAVNVHENREDTYYWWLQPKKTTAKQTATRRNSKKNLPTSCGESAELVLNIHLINLDRSEGRLAEFRFRNPHLSNYHRFSAIDGATLDRDDLISRGMVAADLPYKDGTLACAMSHIALWEKAISTNSVVTVLEDDALLCEKFNEWTTDILKSLPRDWDFIQWGYVYDPLYVWVDLGFSKAKIEFYDRKNAEDALLKAKHRPLALRLSHSFGLQGYSVSPSGAKHLLEHCLPLRRRHIEFNGAGVQISDDGIDCVMNGIYDFMKAYICVPPLIIQNKTLKSDRIHTDKTLVSMNFPADQAALITTPGGYFDKTSAFQPVNQLDPVVPLVHGASQPRLQSAVDEPVLSLEVYIDAAKLARTRSKMADALRICEQAFKIHRGRSDLPPSHWHPLLFEYAIAGRHSPDPNMKISAISVADWLMLAPHNDPEIRQIARDSTHLVEAAREIFPSLKCIQVPVITEEGWFATNPSISQNEDKFFVSVRVLNFVDTGLGYFYTPGNLPFRSKNALIELDFSFNVISQSDILEPSDTPPIVADNFLGFEDLRLWVHEGELWCSSNVLQYDGEIRIATTRIKPINDGTYQMHELCLLKQHANHNKNWMPISNMSGVNFVQFDADILLLDASGHIIRKMSGCLPENYFHGGSQFIPWDNGSLGVIHEISTFGEQGIQNYAQRFIWIDHEGVPRRMSSRFVFERHAVELVGGLAIGRYADELLISFGVGGQECWIATLNSNEVIQSLWPIDKLLEPSQPLNASSGPCLAHRPKENKRNRPFLENVS